MDSIILNTDIGCEYSKDFLESDLIFDQDFKNLPIYQHNFPKSYYTGSAGVKEFEYKDINVYGVSFLIGNEEKFKNLFENVNDAYQDFFTILFIDGLNGESRNKISSRNFPDYYIGQGYKHLKKCKINYISHLNFTGESIAIVNEKIFNLTENGKTIILIGLNDGSLRYIQVKTEKLPKKDITTFYKALLNKPEIVKLIKKAKG